MHAVRPGAQRLAIARFVEASEGIRQARRQAWQGRRHPEGKRFTQAELRDVAYPSYHHLLAGTTGQLPSRSQVQQIAGYLECSLRERNELLIAAEYLPERVELDDAQHREALQTARALLHALPLPGVVLTQGWTIAAGNALFHELHGIDQVLTIPESQRSALHYLFDPALPFRALLGGSGATWENNVAHLLPLLQVPAPMRHEAWYQATLDGARLLPNFNAHRRALDPGEDPAARGRPLVLHGGAGRRVQLQMSIIVVTPAYFPALLVGFPACDSGRRGPAPLFDDLPGARSLQPGAVR